MDPATWTILGVFTAIVLGVGGVLVRAMDRLNKNEAKADAANARADTAALSVAAIGIRIDQLDAELTRHQIATAEKYVSKGTLESLENKIVTAIDRLGDRIDNLVTATAQRPPHVA